jgi:hypothetical protein
MLLFSFNSLNFDIIFKKYLKGIMIYLKSKLFENLW